MNLPGPGRGADRRHRADPAAGGPAGRLAGRAVQHRPEGRARRSSRSRRCCAGPEPWDRVCVTSFSAEQAARRAAGARPAGVHGRLPDRHRRGPVRRPARAAGPDPAGPGRRAGSGGPASRSGPGLARPAAAGQARRRPRRAGHPARAGRAAGPDRACAALRCRPRWPRPAFVSRAHALGLHVHAWTVNSPDLMREAAGHRGRRHHDRRDRGAAGRADQPRRVAPPPRAVTQPRPPRAGPGG